MPPPRTTPNHSSRHHLLLSFASEGQPTNNGQVWNGWERKGRGRAAGRRRGGLGVDDKQVGLCRSTHPPTHPPSLHLRLEVEAGGCGAARGAQGLACALRGGGGRAPPPASRRQTGVRAGPGTRCPSPCFSCRAGVVHCGCPRAFFVLLFSEGAHAHGPACHLAARRPSSPPPAW